MNVNLHDCRVQFFGLPESILRLDTKTSLSTAVEVYKSGCTLPLQPHKGETSYRARQLADVTRVLVERGVLREPENRQVELVSLDMEADRSIAKERIVMPYAFDYALLTPTALKVIIACHSLTRYRRTPFRFTVTNERLAEHARVADRRIGRALKELEAHWLIKTKKQGRTGTQITLLDPESEVELYYLGIFHLRRMNGLTPAERYNIILEKFDPKGTLSSGSSSEMTGYSVHCPFCTTKGSATTFRFRSDDGEDHWACYNCRRSGDSARLWARLEPWIQTTDWRTMMRSACNLPPAQVNASMPR
jgi:hypothetical protein